MFDNAAYNIDKTGSQNPPCNAVNTKVSCFTFTANLCKYFEQMWGDVHTSTESTHIHGSALKQNGSRFLKSWFRTQKVSSCH